MVNRNLYKVLLCIINAFGNSVCYLIGFAKTITNNTISITNYHDSGEAKSSTTFNNLGYTVNGYYSLFKLDFACLYATYIILQHIL